MEITLHCDQNALQGFEFVGVTQKKARGNRLGLFFWLFLLSLTQRHLQITAHRRRRRTQMNEVALRANEVAASRK